MNRIFITGVGIITALGEGLRDNRQALTEGRSGIGRLDLFPTRYAGVLPCGEIKLDTPALQQKTRGFESGVTRTMLLALSAVQEAIADAGLTDAQLKEAGTGLVSATTVGGMCLTDELYKDATRSTDGSVYLSSYDLGSVAYYLQARYGFGGVVSTINTACSSSANALGYGARLLRHGLTDRVIAGGVDSLAKFTVNGFNALHILSPDRCAPFDQDRKGLNLGEGAAFVVMEREADIKSRKVYAEFKGFGNANDAYHPSSLSPEGDGPYLAMLAALRSAGLTSGDIDFINTHGTATENNDEVESRAMLRLFGLSVPSFVSTKANTGHTLGAAGAVSSVFSLLNLVHQEVYPALSFQTPIAATGLSPVKAFGSSRLEHVMSNAFGFGGNCTSLIFTKA